jgi:hypothetical protein
VKVSFVGVWSSSLYSENALFLWKSSSLPLVYNRNSVCRGNGHRSLKNCSSRFQNTSSNHKFFKVSLFIIRIQTTYRYSYLCNINICCTNPVHNLFSKTWRGGLLYNTSYAVEIYQKNVLIYICTFVAYYVKVSVWLFWGLFVS